jgi:hypothetical protein
MFKKRHKLALILAAVTVSFSATVLADPPSRVARLGYSSGAVSFSPAGDDDWVVASVNRPLIAGDRLWADAGARDELQIGGAAVRMGGSTLVTLLNLDDRVTQIQLLQGRLNVRVRHLAPKDVFEIDTPNLALSIRQPGDYRVDVDPLGNTTTVMVRKGQAEVYGESAGYVIDDQQSYRFGGTDLRDYQSAELPPADDFDLWASQRDRRADNSVSARYVSRDVTGYQDLDEHGTWSVVQGYGNVWTPSRVAAGWTPYRDGHWSWVEPWGWTWVDDAPWGFAVSHYGRWTNMRGNWGWVPGPAAARPVYAPALVAFVGGGNLQLPNSRGNGGGVAWFPLAPREVYRPAYKVSQNYFTNINAGNTTVNKTVNQTVNQTVNRTSVTNVYNNVNNITYINRQVNGAVVAVPAATFVRSQPVAKAVVVLPRESLAKAPVTPGAAVAPQHLSIRGNGAAGMKPAPAALARQAIVKTAPPPPALSFASKQAALSANRGRPLDAAAIAAMRRAAPKQAPQIKLVKLSQSAAPLGKPAARAPAPGAVLPVQVPPQPDKVAGQPVAHAGAPLAAIAPAKPEGKVAAGNPNLAAPRPLDVARGAMPLPVAGKPAGAGPLLRPGAKPVDAALHATAQTQGNPAAQTEHPVSNTATNALRQIPAAARPDGQTQVKRAGAEPESLSPAQGAPKVERTVEPPAHAVAKVAGMPANAPKQVKQVPAADKSAGPGPIQRPGGKPSAAPDGGPPIRVMPIAEKKDAAPVPALPPAPTKPPKPVPAAAKPAGPGPMQRPGAKPEDLAPPHPAPAAENKDVPGVPPGSPPAKAPQQAPPAAQPKPERHGPGAKPAGASDEAKRVAQRKHEEEVKRAEQAKREEEAKNKK